MSDTPEPTTRADILLKESLTLMQPLARAMVANGVTYPVFAQALKHVFLAAAKDELGSQGKRMTDSALSLLSGVHRKDVRAMANLEERPVVRALSLAIEVATRWSSDPLYCDNEGRPRSLPLRARSAGDIAFEQLTQAVSKDFHSRSVLEEMLRLGVVTQDGETVSLTEDGFVPRESFAEAAFFLGANGADHIAAAVANLQQLGQGSESPFLEHAVFADELSAESAQQLRQLARRLWVSTFRRFAQAAQDAVDQDQALPIADRQHRVRFGSYCYTAEMAAPIVGESQDDDAGSESDGGGPKT